jgi:hypothetical protein
MTGLDPLWRKGGEANEKAKKATSSIRIDKIRAIRTSGG